MPLPFLALAAMAAPALMKLGTGIFQMNQHADRVDTVTPAEREMLAAQRQAAASNVLPGMGAMQNQLAQNQAATVQNAQLGAGSSADFLAAGSAADATRQQGEMQLGVQGQQYQDRSRAALAQGVAHIAGLERDDTNRANMANAAFKGSGLTNIFGGLNDGASAAVYASGAGAGAGGAADETETTMPYTRALRNMFSLPR